MSCLSVFAYSHSPRTLILHDAPVWLTISGGHSLSLWLSQRLNVLVSPVKIVLPVDTTTRGLSSGVEFVPESDVKRVFGLPPDHAKLLATRGEIESFCVKEFGAAHGLRLYSAASIRAYLRKHSEKPAKRKSTKEGK